MKKPQNPSGADKIELLSFRIGSQEYSVDIMSVREIRSWTKATPLPHSPPYILGVINLRGKVLPIIDLAKRLGVTSPSTSLRKVFIVVTIQNLTVGLLVDTVVDILSITKDEPQPPPDMLLNYPTGFISALSVVEGRMMRILDLNSVVLVDDVHSA